jgi:hypothetical protein
VDELTGLLDSRVYGVYADSTGAVWFATGKGVARRTDGAQPSAVEERPAALPTAYRLRAYPNPANPGTVLSWSLPASTQVTVTVYSLLGQRMRVLVDASCRTGVHTVAWDGRDGSGQPVASGVYLVRLATPAVQLATKVTLLR